LKNEREFPAPSGIALAAAAASASNAQEIGPALKEGFASNEVTLLDIVTDPAARPPITSFEGHFE